MKHTLLTFDTKEEAQSFFREISADKPKEINKYKVEHKKGFYAVVAYYKI